MKTIILLLILVFLSSCNNKTVYYVDSLNVVHTDKKCKEISVGGIKILNNENIKKVSFCGNCMSEKEIDICNSTITYNQKRYGRELFIQYVSKQIQNDCDVCQEIPLKEFIDTLFILNENSEWVYDRISLGTIRFGIYSENELKSAKDEIMKLSKDEFVIRLKRWVTEGVTGYSNDIEEKLDYMFNDSIK